MADVRVGRGEVVHSFRPTLEPVLEVEPGTAVTMEDAFVFLSVACDVGVTQGCRPAPDAGMIARFQIPKIEACPAPFSR